VATAAVRVTTTTADGQIGMRALTARITMGETEADENAAAAALHTRSSPAAGQALPPAVAAGQALPPAVEDMPRRVGPQHPKAKARAGLR
jgi:hypothetical protein